MTVNKIKAEIDNHRADFDDLGVRALDLFGSTVHQNRSEDSDYDFLVEFERPTGYITFYQVKLLLEDILKTSKIDLVLKRALLEDFRDEILGDATPCL